MNELGEQFIDAACEHLQEGSRRIERCLAQMSQPQIWQDHNQQLVSAGNLVLHLCGNITQYILSGIGEAADQRQRDAEFSDKPGMSGAELTKCFAQVIEAAVAVLHQLAPEALEEQRRIQGFDHNVCSAILHVVEHMSYHIGQISFICKLMTNVDLGYYAGLDLNTANESAT